MKKLLLPVIALATLTAPAIAQQSPWSINAYYSFCSKELAAVATNRIDRIDDLFKISWLDLDVNAFAGGGGDKVIAGFSATMSYEVAQGWFFSFGLGLDGDFSDPLNINFRNVGLGVTFGLSRRF